MGSKDSILVKDITYRNFVFIGIIICFVLILCTNTVFAADIYMSTIGTKTSGKSTSGDWSNTNCYNNLQAAMVAMSSGDTLTIDDGSYTGAINTISGYNRPPSGPGTGVDDARFTIVKARNIPGLNGYPENSPLKVYLPTGLFALSGGTPGTYIKFWGLKFSEVNTYTGWHHLYFKQCAFMGTGTGNSIAAGFGGYPILVEDSVFYGMDRYKLNFSNYLGDGANPVTNDVCRRCVARNDSANANYNSGTSYQDPIASFASYGNVGDAFLNCIDIDSDSPAYWSNSSIEFDGAFYAPKPIGGNMLVQGSIVINNAAGVGSSTGSFGVTYTDVAGIKVGGGMYHKAGATINRFTLVNAGTGNFSGYLSNQIMAMLPTYAGIGGSDATAVATNSILRELTNPMAFYGNSTGNYINTFSIASMGDGITNQITTEPFKHGLLYPVRIEPGSTLATAGSNGGQIGARILNKLGKDGTFKGDTDWNTEQGALWPWPLENWVKAEMGAMPTTIGGSVMPSPTRGFASPTAKQLDGVSPVTLTSYIWESLGNPIPTEIYNTSADIIAPTVTAFTIPASRSIFAVPISTLLATDNIAVTAYMITETVTPPAGSGAGWLSSPPVSFTFVSSGSKTLYAWAKDAAGNVSASRSANVIITTIDTEAPTVTALATPSSSSALIVPNIALMASDNVSVTGYMLNETATTPASSALGWVPAPPTSYTFATAGSKTLYARAKDAAGNVSSAVSATVLVDLSQSAGNTYYLDPAGVDTNPCSQTLPCRQLARALSLVVAGDTILLADGTYAGADVTEVGTAQAPITIKAQGNNAVISARSNVRGNLYLNNCSYVIVDGIKTSGGTGTLAAGIAVRFSDHITVKNSTTYNNNVWGIFVSNSPNILLENNESYGQTTQHGIYIADATASHDQPVIRGNRLHDNAMIGLHMNGDNGGTGYFSAAVVENNIIYNNGSTGINMDGVQNSIIRNNLLYNNHGSGIAMYQTDAVTGPSGNQVLNNTIDMASNSKWAIRHTSSVGVSTFRNNIFYNRNLANGGISTNTTTDVSNTDSDYNVFAGSTNAATPNDGSTYYTLAQWQAVGKDTHSISATASSLFMASGVDYHLAANSPAIDKGQTLAAVAVDMDGNNRPNGLAFDMGSFEFVPSSDSIAPVVASFTMPASGTALAVAVTTFTATDNIAVTGYLITESATKPAAGASGWTVAAPTSFTFSSAGSKTAHAWAKDAAGNVSLSRSATVTITLPDTTAPVVSAFSLPATAKSLTLVVSAFTASDTVGVTGYLITESSTAPAASATGWTASAPTSFTFSAAGTKTAYAWGKDAAGNVSLSRSATVSIDTVAPMVSIGVRKDITAVSGMLSVTATASDNVGVSRVELYINGVHVSTATSAPYAFNWDSSAATTGSYTLMSRSYDAAGNSGQSASIKISVPNVKFR